MPQAARQQLGLPHDGFVYLSLGQVRPYKGVEELLRAFSGLHGEDLSLVIAGRVQQPDHGELLRSLAAGEPRVQLHLRYVPDDELQIFMNAADVAVLPYRQTTTSGAAILALSFGLPVVAPEIGPFPALLSQGGGILYDPQDSQALARALHEAREADPAGMRQAARDTAGSLDWEPIGRLLVDLYQEVMRDDA